MKTGYSFGITVKKFVYGLIGATVGYAIIYWQNATVDPKYAGIVILTVASLEAFRNWWNHRHNL